MNGVLRLIQIKEIEGFPVVMVQLTGVDVAGTEKGVVFEYELPFNFQFDGSLYSTLSVFPLAKGEFVGFLFNSASDKD